MIEHRTLRTTCLLECTMLPRVFPVVIRPSRAKSILILCTCAAFALGGLLMIAFAESFGEMAAGFLGVLFFGGGALFAGPRLLGSEPTLTVEGRGLRPRDGGYLPWSNVSEAGVVRIQTTVKCFAVRIVDYGLYASSLTEAELQRFKSGGNLARGVSMATVGVAALQDDFSTDMLIKDDRDDMQSLLSVPGGADVARALLWNRNRTGWDLLWPQSVLNYKAEDIANTCNELRQSS